MHLLKKKGKHRNQRIQFIAAVFAAAMLLSACRTSAGEYAGGELFAMDTYMTWDIPDENAEQLTTGLQEIIRSAERMLSVTDTESELFQINAHAGERVLLSAEMAGLLARCLALADETGGAFNPALYPLIKAWGFTTEESRVPDEAEREELLAFTDWRQIVLEADAVTLSEQMALDLGAVGKGYVTDVCVDYLKQNQVSSAMLRLGGNVYALGSKLDGSDWRIGIELPFSEGALAGVVRGHDMAVITSGNYQRYFEVDGKRYHHIIDGETGAPAESGLDSVTIITDQGVTADALSTAYFVMGLEESVADWQTREDIEVIWITSEGEIYYTEGLADCFTVSEGLEAKQIHRS